MISVEFYRHLLQKAPNSQANLGYLLLICVLFTLYTGLKGGTSITKFI